MDEWTTPREPDLRAPTTSGHAAESDRSGAWKHRHRDLDTTDEVIEMVTRQYVDISQDDMLAAYFNFGPGHLDWQAHIAAVSDFWCHVLFKTGPEAVDTLSIHRPLHAHRPFTAELFDRWLQTFHDTIDGGWSGQFATMANKRATGLAWVMAHHILGPGVRRPAEHSPSGELR